MVAIARQWGNAIVQDNGDSYHVAYHWQPTPPRYRVFECTCAKQACEHAAAFQLVLPPSHVRASWYSTSTAFGPVMNSRISEDEKATRDLELTIRWQHIDCEPKAVAKMIGSYVAILR